MKTFLFRFSRVLSILTILMLFIFNGSVFFLIYKVSGETYGIISYIISTVVIFIPILIFNWLCFGKLNIWIKKSVLENEL